MNIKDAVVTTEVESYDDEKQDVVWNLTTVAFLDDEAMFPVGWTYHSSGFFSQGLRSRSSMMLFR